MTNNPNQHQLDACSTCRSHTNCKKAGCCLYPQTTVLPAAPPKPAPDAVREALKKPDLAYASTNQIAACRCGSFPTLYSDGARPDDGYCSLWCQTCMEHVAEMKPSEREVIDYWNDLREREHAVLAAPVPSPDHDTLYAILSKHIPQDMIDGIWQEIQEARAQPEKR